ARVTIRTTRPNVEQVMRLASEVLREPAFPPSEFDQLKTQQLAGIESARSEPTTIAPIALNQQMRPYPEGDPRHVRSVDETIAALKAVKLEDAVKFYHDFYGGSNAEMVIVGDFDPESMQKIAQDNFGTWKSPSLHHRLPQTFQSVEA